MKSPGLFALVVCAGLGCEAGVHTQPTYARYGPEARLPQSEWVQLADRYSADAPSQQIDLRGRGEFRKIRVEGARGAPVINKVTIDYSDDEPAQVVPIHEQLSPGEGRDIDLNGGRRPVKRIIVYAEPGYGGAYSVLGV